MATYTVSNKSPGARGVSGGVLIESGQNLTGVELDDSQSLALEYFDGVEVIEETE